MDTALNNEADLEAVKGHVSCSFCWCLAERGLLFGGDCAEGWTCVLFWICEVKGF